MTPVIATASPTLRSRTTSSVRGVVIFLAAMIPPSELHGLVPLRVALHVHGHGHAGDVAGHLLDEHVESRGRAAEALPHRQHAHGRECAVPRPAAQDRGTLREGSWLPGRSRLLSPTTSYVTSRPATPSRSQ